MNVRVTPAAQRDLLEIISYIASDNSVAAARVLDHILEIIQQVADGALSGPEVRLLDGRRTRRVLGTLTDIATELPDLRQLDRLTLLAESAEWTTDPQAGVALARGARAGALSILGGIQVATGRRVTLTSRTGHVPVTILNRNHFPVRVLVALESALQAMSADSSRPILVGGVDTFLDLRLLATLGAEGRVHGPRVMDGFIPGEGAAFLWIEGGREPASGTPVIHGAASTTDPGHRYGTEPARGEGLAQALQLLRDRLPSPVGPIASTFTGLNGENFDAKLWGVAQLRHKDLFSANMTLEHPASCFGDTGAATGAILTALTAAALAAGHRAAPALVWAASDLGARGCTIVGPSAPVKN